MRCRKRSIRRWRIFIATSASRTARWCGAFADAGCRYLQLDEVNLAYLCDPSLREHIVARGEDPAALPDIYAGMINAAIADIPADMTITMHLCRGNFRSSFVASGGYEPVAEALFNAIKVHGYFMEYDSDRAGGFEPLRFVPKGKMVVLGLVTSKSGALESRDEIKTPDRAGGEICGAGSALPVAAMRLCFDRGRQCPVRGRAMGEAAHHRRNRRGGVGNIMKRRQASIPRRSRRQSAAPRGAESGARAPRQGRDHCRRFARRSKIARSRTSSRNRKPSACNRSATANSAAPGGTSISSGGSTASNATSWTPGSLLPRSPPATKAYASPASSAFPVIRCSSISSFCKAHTKRTPKMTIPAPSALYGRPMRTPIDKALYPTLDEFFDDLGQAYKKAVRAFCRRRLPLLAARRSVHRHAVRSEIPPADDRTAATIRIFSAPPTPTSSTSRYRTSRRT